jgi:hypothetical protein
MNAARNDVEFTIHEMAMVLFEHGVDLGDERAVIMKLQSEGFTPTNIAVLTDMAIERARLFKANMAVPA